MPAASRSAPTPPSASSSAIPPLAPGGSRLARRAPCDGVLLTVPSNVSAGILGGLAPEAAELLGAIAYSGVVTVSFAWPADVIAGSRLALVGSGVLVPRRHGLLTTALSLTSSKWPRSARPDEIVVRASAGRLGDGRALALGDDDAHRAG